MDAAQGHHALQATLRKRGSASFTKGLTIKFMNSPYLQDSSLVLDAGVDQDKERLHGHDGLPGQVGPLHVVHVPLAVRGQRAQEPRGGRRHLQVRPVAQPLAEAEGGGRGVVEGELVDGGGVDDEVVEGGEGADEDGVDATVQGEGDDGGHVGDGPQVGPLLAGEIAEVADGAALDGGAGVVVQVL